MTLGKGLLYAILVSISARKGNPGSSQIPLQFKSSNSEPSVPFPAAPWSVDGQVGGGRLQLGLMAWLCSRLSWLGARAPPFLVQLRHHRRKSRCQAKYGASDPGFSHLQAWAQTSAAVDRSAAFQPLQMLTQKLYVQPKKPGGSGGPEQQRTSRGLTVQQSEALSSNGK